MLPGHQRYHREKLEDDHGKYHSFVFQMTSAAALYVALNNITKFD
ncbi:hypothetical protein PALB_35090 [Pseudoalteromonas luteoviolacea B = ATCC 29581]|nr:hypothetical protein PALB_35090 [Pseudoalteromonas luteoviolacea B = ATCC 29581]